MFALYMSELPSNNPDAGKDTPPSRVDTYLKPLLREMQERLGAKDGTLAYVKIDELTNADLEVWDALIALMQLAHRDIQEITPKTDRQRALDIMTRLKGQFDQYKGSVDEQRKQLAADGNLGRSSLYAWINNRMMATYANVDALRLDLSYTDTPEAQILEDIEYLHSGLEEEKSFIRA